MPHVLLEDVFHDEAGRFEPVSAVLVELLVDATRVEQLALDLEDQGHVQRAEVDAPDPAGLVAEVDLTPHRRKAGRGEDLHHP
jgi:hypothetical protein